MSDQPSGITLEECRVLVVKALNDVVDPCSATFGTPSGLVDMGLVVSLECAPSSSEAGRFDATIGLRLTGPGCAYVFDIEHRVEAEISSLPPVAKVTIEWPEADLWSPEDMAPDLRQRRAERMAALDALVPTRPRGL